MAISYTEALAAYRRAFDQATQGAPGQPGSGAADSGAAGTGSPNFAEVLRSEAKETVGTLQTAENQSLAAAAGEANLQEVVLAMTKAESTLQTVVTIRDRAMQAYQEIMRMPI